MGFNLWSDLFVSFIRRGGMCANRRVDEPGDCVVQYVVKCWHIYLTDGVCDGVWDCHWTHSSACRRMS